MDRLLALLMISGSLAFVAPALASGISGTYVGKGSNCAFLIQIVGTSDGRLTGRYEQVIMDKDGKLEDTNAEISGASDGSTVIATIKPSEFLAGSLAVSGTISGNLLHLTGGGNGRTLTLNLTLSDEAEFRADVDALNQQSVQINSSRAAEDTFERQAKILQEQFAYIQNLTTRMVAFTKKSDKRLAQIPGLEQRYRETTRRMNSALTRERSIYGGGQAGVARSQISIAITQASIEIGQVHMSVDSAHEDFNSTFSQLSHEAAAVKQRCRNAHIPPEKGPLASFEEGVNSACLSFFPAAKDFEQRAATLREGFAEIEGVWDNENHQQDQIVQASNDAAR